MGIKFQENTNTLSDSYKKSQRKEDWFKKEIHFGKPKLNLKKKASFYNELSILLESGIHLKNALEILIESVDKPFEKQLFSSLVDTLINGGSLSHAMQASTIFDKYECEAIKIGEETGNLTNISTQLTNLYQQKITQRNEIISAITYPLIVLITAVIVVTFMLNYVVPLFEDIFKQNQVDLPWITQQIISFSAFLRLYSKWIIVVIVMIVFSISFLSKKNTFQRKWQNFILHIPIIGNYLKNIKLSQFSQAVTLTSEAKMDITTSLEMSSKMIRFFPLEKAIKDIHNDIISGQKVSEAFSKHKQLFDHKMLALLRVAEETNNTSYVFSKLHQQFQQEVNKQSKLIADILNPVLIVLVGLIVGIILISMYLPMFRLSTIIS